MVNAGKYFFSLLVQALNLILALDPSILWLWCIVAVISSGYAYCWDIAKDWGLLERDARFKFLRLHLGYRRPQYYYFAIVTDLFLRFSWVMSISTNIV